MNELQRMCADVPPPSEPTVAEGRRRLLTAARGEGAGEVAMKSRRRSRSPRPWRVIGPVGLAAALALGVVVAQWTGRDRAASPPDVKNVSAGEILHRAAAAARTEPELHLRADQYLYVRSKEAWGPGITHPGQPKGGDIREVWLSADGSRPGLLRMPCRNDPARTCERPLVNEDAAKVGPTPVPGSYLWNLKNIPRELSRLQAEMDRPNPHPTEPLGKGAWEAINDELGESYLPPKLRAQIFDFLADIPGTEVERNAADATGRPGIAVTKTMYNARSEFVFDRETYRFLGKREIYLGPLAVESVGQVTDWRNPPPGGNFDRAFTVLEVKAVNRLRATS